MEAVFRNIYENSHWGIIKTHFHCQNSILLIGDLCILKYNSKEISLIARD